MVLIFSRGIEAEHWFKMGWNITCENYWVQLVLAWIRKNNPVKPDVQKLVKRTLKVLQYMLHDF